jgi:hypothetical protein
LEITMNNEHIARLRKASAANEMWGTLANTHEEGDPYVVHGAVMSARGELIRAVRDAIESGMTPDQVAHEACLPYVGVLVLSGFPVKSEEGKS